MHDIAWIIFLFILGSCVGSFLNVVVWRLPRNESLVHPPSHCPRCGHKLAWYDNVPIFGWIALRGRCRYCGQGISIRYPVVEAITGLIFALTYVLIFVLGFGPCTFAIDDFTGQVIRNRSLDNIAEDWPYLGLYLFLLSALLAASLIDAELFIIPSGIPHLMALVGLIVHTLVDRPGQSGALNVGPAAGALAIGSAVGLIFSILGLKLGWLKVSFPHGEPVLDVDREAIASQIEQAKREGKQAPELPPAYTPAEIRAEIRREMVFLMPPLLAGGLWLTLYLLVGPVQRMWDGVMSYHWASALAGSVLGALVGGFTVWLTRILGTLAFGRVAMGLGDVHLMFGVGAIIGAGQSVMAFFLAPFFGILVSLYLLVTRSQREVPYGPYLGLASAVVLLFYGDIALMLQLPQAAQGLLIVLQTRFGGG